MKFNLASQDEANQAFTYLTDLVGKGAIAEVKRISPRRSLSQNNYLHVILSYWGTETGYTLAEAKTLYKRDVNPDIYVYDKNGVKFLKSSADLTKDEMTHSIDRFREWSAENGIRIPGADEEEFLRWIENQVESQGNYL